MKKIISKYSIVCFLVIVLLLGTATAIFANMDFIWAHKDFDMENVVYTDAELDDY